MEPRLAAALEQIQSARNYLQTLLADLDDQDYFRQPTGWATHVAWQIGHLAMAEYGLCLFRMRGRAEGDSELMPSAFRKQFGKGSRPDPDPAKNPAPAELRERLDRIHAQVLAEAPTFTSQQLDQPVEMPYAGPATCLGAFQFAAHHEMLHAGQIGAIRRLLGKDPVR